MNKNEILQLAAAILIGLVLAIGIARFMIWNNNATWQDSSCLYKQCVEAK